MQAGGKPDRTAGDPLLRAVLDCAPQGFSLWDLDHRLAVFNQPYLDLYRFPAGSVRLGMSLREICDLTVSVGNHPDVTADELLTIYEHRLAAAQGSPEPLRAEKAIRGRVIVTTHTFTPGIGWTVIHEDVTEATERKWMAELTEKSLDAQNRRFTAALDNMSHGLSIFDSEMRLVVCNQPYLDIYGLTPKLVHAGTPLVRIAEFRCDAGTAPVDMPDFVEFVSRSRGPLERFVETSRLENGRSIQVTRSPIAGGGFVAVHQDVTEDTARLEEIAVQKMRFEAALANAAHGLSMYDAQWRLVVSNDRFHEIYGIPEELRRSGTTFADLAAYRDAPGSFERIAKSDELVKAVLGEVSSERETVEAFRIPGGRVVSVRQAATPDGGFIRTHQDITTQVERFETLKRTEREAAKQNRALKQQNVLFDAAINNMNQGLCMFDRHERLVVCNERYALIYNLTTELTKPGTTLTQIMEHRFSHGMVPKAGRDNYMRGRQRLVNEALEARDEIELEDGRSIFIHHRPMKGGGWVATHEDVTEQRRMEARVRHLARHDALTDLPNRAFLREEMDRIAARIKRRENIAFLCFDLDHFKAVNDTLGHVIGDQVLVNVAARLKKFAREGDVVARLGGDEFAMIAMALDDPQDAAGIASRIVKSIAAPMEIEGHQVNIGTSVGIALAPGDGDDVETLLKNADTALYRAKSEGRGNYHFFERGMDDALQYRRMLEQGLKVALAHGEFRLMFQPLVDLSTNKICCFEALLRWDHPEQGTISPAEFIPVAEETGLIGSIGEWVLRQACAAAAGWPGDVRVAVNLSAVQFKNRGLINHVIHALGDAGLDARRLELEVTESLLLADTPHTLETLHQLRALGVRISMDDFGTGYSSLSYLRSFPFDKIKIDRTFVAGLAPGDESTAIIRAVVGLGQSLGMSTTAEGVETEEQLAAVRAQGCNEVQGFLFSPPLPPSGVTALLRAGGDLKEFARKRA
jgi:diguanylate cyclase (GGDEF)-like protein